LRHEQPGATVKHPSNSKFYSWLKAWRLVCLGLLLSTGLRAGPVLDPSSPLAFFTSAADSLLKAQPEFAQAGLSVTNIPVYPTNGYTPAVHRLLQLAANLYDASTNKTTAAPDDFDYPSVFRPTFTNVVIDGVTNVIINGYTTNVWFSHPVDVTALLDPASTNANVYGIPWVIGARKGFPNFNQVSMQDTVSLTRKLQIVKDPSNPPDHLLWHTNIQYALGISNVVGVQAWNSYVVNYPRALNIICFDEIDVGLTNQNGPVVLVPPQSNHYTNTAFLSIPANTWNGYPVSPNAPATNIANSFDIVINVTNAVLPEAVFHPNGTYTVTTNVQSVPFDTTTGYPLPIYGLSLTNRLWFYMLDSASGRVIDYVQLNGMESRQDLLSELPSNGGFGPGGVWDTNRVDGTTNEAMPILGIVNQVQASLQNPPYVAPNYPTPITIADWQRAGFPGGSTSVSQAVQQFIDFYFNVGNNPSLVMQVPYTPTRQISVYSTWQANDPLVHYTLSDLTGLGDFSTAPVTNHDQAITDFVQPHLFRVNNRYVNWGATGNLFPDQYADYFYDPAIIDPSVTRSDDWNFPNGPLNAGWIGQVHRGTPWQTVYLKAAPVDPVMWQNWTGDASLGDAAIFQPFNDWRLAALLAWLFNPTDPRQLTSANSTNLSGALDGISVVTNSVPSPATLVMSSNSPQAAIIVNGINAARANQPGQLFGGAGDILATPELSLNSPWLDLDDDAIYEITDADYEMIPSQLLPLLRQDSVGSFARSNGAPQFQFTGFDGFVYEVDVSSNLLSWMPLGTQVTTNGVLTVSDPAASGLGPRYYRTSLIPQP
jgi:hypothetical protein